METNEQDDIKGQEQKEAIKQEAKGLFKSVRKFLVDLLDFRGDTDRETTLEAVKADIPFKGATAWILIFAVFIASIGLNVSSTAVVIGAMLISPLMGPILGVGMSLAINDIDTLKRSVINLLVMVVLSVLTAYLYFKLSPLTELTPELEARTSPTILDVFVAIFGGLALIVARTKKGTIATVIFGVAIATALMPPLCTAGYGLAVANIDYFLGAMYLFCINSIFIALATFVVVKLLRFPMIKYANSKRRKRIARIVSVLAIVSVIPAGVTFYDVLNESQFNSDAKLFISTELASLPNSNYLKRQASYNYIKGDFNIIEIPAIGQDQIPESTQNLLRARLADYAALKETHLIFGDAGSRDNLTDELRFMAELRQRDSLDLLNQSQKIQFYEEELAKLRRLERDIIPFEAISQEAKINYDGLEQLQYAITIQNDYKKIDTLAVFGVKWNDSITQSTRTQGLKKITTWLKFKLSLDTLVVREIK